MDSHDATHLLLTQTVALDWRRWHMLAMYSGGTMCNALMWVSFSPIADFTSRFFDVSLTLTNVLGLVFLALYLPGTMIAAAVLNADGLRAVVTLGAALTWCAAIVRFAGCCLVGFGVASPNVGYGIVLFGQILAGLAQPCFTNTPARLAAEWFGPKERDIATAIGSLFNPVGSALGQVLPSVFVSCVASPCTSVAVHGMVALTGVQLAVASAVTLWTALFLRREPALPPSSSAAERRALRRSAAAVASQSSTHVQPSLLERSRAAFTSIRADLCAMLRNVEFLKLLFGFGIGLALFNALVAVLEQLIQPTYCATDGTFDSGRKDAAQLHSGIYGATLIVAGLLGACVVGPVLECTHCYRTMLKLCMTCASGALTLLVFLLQPGYEVKVGVCFALMGLFMLPLLPAALESAVEVTYPVAEDSSTAVLLLFGNTLGIGFTFAMQCVEAIPSRLHN
jgi:MFS family permease